MSEPTWFYPRGALARDEWQTVIDDTLRGWQYAGLRIVETSAGQPVVLAATDLERMFVPLAGSFDLRWASESADGGKALAGEIGLAGRSSVFKGPTDVAFVGANTSVTVTGTGRLAIAEARATTERPPAHLARADVPVELRGAGRSTRQVHNFGVPGALDADRLIVCEVITPSENWSSYPAHKHDELVAGSESNLEEIYYFEAAVSAGIRSPADARPFGMFAARGSARGELSITAVVQTGDVALVPFGYHGPAAAAPGYDLYYLNVMAGPDAAREWRITDDPQQSWVRDLWTDETTDPRLPYGAAKEHRA